VTAAGFPGQPLGTDAAVEAAVVAAMRGGSQKRGRSDTTASGDNATSQSLGGQFPSSTFTDGINTSGEEVDSTAVAFRSQLNVHGVGGGEVHAASAVPARVESTHLMEVLGAMDESPHAQLQASSAADIDIDSGDLSAAAAATAAAGAGAVGVGDEGVDIGAAAREEEEVEGEGDDNKRARYTTCSQLTESISQWASDMYDNYGPPDFCAMNGLFGMGVQGVGTAWEESADGTAQMFAKEAEADMVAAFTAAPAAAADEEVEEVPVAFTAAPAAAADEEVEEVLEAAVLVG